MSGVLKTGNGVGWVELSEGRRESRKGKRVYLSFSAYKAVFSRMERDQLESAKKFGTFER